MKRISLVLLSAASCGFALPVFAQPADCAAEIRKVDEALAKGPQVDADKLQQVRKLRDDAEKLRAQGKNAECVATIERAKAMLKLGT
ncbi:hypothetical protein FBR04_10285 [Betaproteobacteria bacterium PRO7]|jgi:hypothetical protein|nr:hypothetical protein [Burkholderiaceae bacterium]MDL1861401.1 hypothetical protein [Betaproteobacteria bacterium PRO7]GIL06567.1 MAG: hypothetical protein BroJett031_30870 [Betaproteobacteria bacterium]